MAIAVVDMAPADVEPLARQRLAGPACTASGLTASGLTASALSGRRARLAARSRRRSARIHNDVIGVIESPEEQRDVGKIPQGFGPVVKVGLEVLLRHPVPGHRAQPEHVLAHQPQELTRAAEMVTLGGEHGIGRAGGPGGGEVGGGGIGGG